MKNKWTNFYTGKVEVKVTGRNVELFVNELVRKNIQIWELKRLNEETILFTVSLNSINSLRVVKRNYNCRVSFAKSGGFPFLFKRLLRNSGFLIGFFLFLICIFLFSNIVLNIEVEGAKPETEYKIRKELTKMGIQKWKLQFFLEGSDAIQRDLTDRIDEITWIGVELKGTAYHLQVVEKKEPKRAKVDDKQNLVAGKKAIIRKIFVEKGKAIVNVNDYVHKGQLLVSGNISKSVLVPAKGIVLGEIWYKSNVEIPLRSEFSVFNGKEETDHYVSFKKTSIPIWGFKKNEIVNFERDETKKPLFFLGWKLPVAYKTVTYRDKENVNREYSRKEAKQKGLEVAESDLKKRLPKNSEIIGRKILHERIENGKVILSIHYQVLENIAIERPIIRGD